MINLPDLHTFFGLSHENAYNSLWFIAIETFIMLSIFLIITEFAGRKTLAQMTMIHFIVAIGIGEALLMPVLDKDFSIWKAIVIAVTSILFIVLLEWLSIKFNWFERLFTPKAMLVIEDGKLNVKNLKKLRMSVDQLEMALRVHSVESISHVRTATVEGDGKIGIELVGEEQPFTVKDMIDMQNNEFPSLDVKNNIFDEIRNYEHGKQNKNQHDKKLQ